MCKDTLLFVNNRWAEGDTYNKKENFISKKGKSSCIFS